MSGKNELTNDHPGHESHMRFDDSLKPQKEWGNHFYSTGTLRDDNEAYRSHYIYGSDDFGLMPVSYGWLAKGSAPSIRPFVGGLLVHDTKTLWGMARDRGRRAIVSLSIDK